MLHEVSWDMIEMGDAESNLSKLGANNWYTVLRKWMKASLISKVTYIICR